MTGDGTVYGTPSFEEKICGPDELAARIASLPRPLVFTNGVFDILHRGHVTYLAQARAQGASLVVGLNSDASAKALGKAPDRPLNGEGDRACVLAALESVSLVTLFDEATPQALRGAVHRAIAAYREPATWRALQRAGMRRDFGWAASARRYVDLYQALGGQSKSTRSARSRPRPGSSGVIR